jgi:hypothetical protein
MKSQWWLIRDWCCWMNRFQIINVIFLSKFPFAAPCLFHLVDHMAFILDKRIRFWLSANQSRLPSSRKSCWSSRDDLFADIESAARAYLISEWWKSKMEWKMWLIMIHYRIMHDNWTTTACCASMPFTKVDRRIGFILYLNLINTASRGCLVQRRSRTRFAEERRMIDQCFPFLNLNVPRPVSWFESNRIKSNRIEQNRQSRLS